MKRILVPVDGSDMAKLASKPRSICFRTPGYTVSTSCK